MGTKNKALDHKKFIFAYFPGKSLMHRLNPISKMFFLVLLTILTFTINSVIFLASISFLLIVFALTSGITLKNLVKKLKFIVFVLIFSVVLNIFFNAIPSDQDVVLFYLFNLSFLPIRRLAVYFALRALFTVLTLYTSAIIFTNTTSMKDFVYSLIRLKIPYTYCFCFMVSIRYIPLIEDLVSILRKTHTTSISMESRCFGLYKKRTNLIKISYKAKDIIFILLCIGVFITIILYIFKLLPLPPIPSLYYIFTNFINLTML
jgi:energy-coupling factor transport system permease protein